MASYRYERDIDPKDLAPRKERQYTRKEKWTNWWDYNLKWVLLIGIAAAFVAYNFIGQYFFVPKPDYNIAVVAPYYLPDDTVTALQTALARYGEDRNGDGKVLVTLNVYTLDYSGEDPQTESAAYLTMAGTTKLATDVQGGLSSIFLLYDPAGSRTAPAPCGIWTAACPPRTATTTGGTWCTSGRTAPCWPGWTWASTGPTPPTPRAATASSTSPILHRDAGAWNTATAENLAGGEELWQALTAGAVSTLREG